MSWKHTLPAALITKGLFTLALTPQSDGGKSHVAPAPGQAQATQKQGKRWFRKKVGQEGVCVMAGERVSSIIIPVLLAILPVVCHRVGCCQHLFQPGCALQKIRLIEGAQEEVCRNMRQPCQGGTRAGRGGDGKGRQDLQEVFDASQLPSGMRTYYVCVCAGGRAGGRAGVCVCVCVCM